MEMHPYEYDTTLPWQPQQNQLYEGRFVSAQADQQQLPRPQKARPSQGAGGQKPKGPEKMPKARALALSRTLKKWLAVASVVGFGTFSGLVAFHQVGTTSATSTQSTQSTQSTSKSSQTNSTSSSNTQNSNNFLNQGGNNIGTNGSSQQSTSSSSSSAVSGTHTS